jgi:Flp pilus assembly protein TadB
MLDDRERRLWQDIERRLAADDPGFAKRTRKVERPPRSSAPLVWGALFYCVTVLLWLLAGWLTAIIGAVVLLMFLPAVLRRARRHQQLGRHGDDRR